MYIRALLFFVPNFFLNSSACFWLSDFDSSDFDSSDFDSSDFDFPESGYFE
jgi:hypothetical protein